MKYFLIAGEASGDLHASNLMRGLINADPGAEFRFMGGERMEEVAGGMLMHYRETNFMMLDVLLHLGKIIRNLRKVKHSIRSWNPDVVIPVDYPGFNMRIARFSASAGHKVYYFISPKVWAWRQRRVRLLKKYTRKLFVILPFEVDYFKQFGMEVEYHGNPLVDAVSRFNQTFEGADAWKRGHELDSRPVVALLAGSRSKEIEATLPLMIRTAEAFPGYQFVVAGAPTIPAAFYRSFLEGSGVRIVEGETYQLLASSEAGLVTSGTATLEAAMFGVPQAVVYKTGRMAYSIAKWLVKVKFISLVNLIYGTELVVEIIQENMPGRMKSELNRILEDPSYRQSMKEGYESILGKLGEPGVTNRIGQRMVGFLKEEEI
jgi:lipid-A-disaccharide synthase